MHSPLSQCRHTVCLKLPLRPPPPGAAFVVGSAPEEGARAAVEGANERFAAEGAAEGRAEASRFPSKSKQRPPSSSMASTRVLIRGEKKVSMIYLLMI